MLGDPPGGHVPLSARVLLAQLRFERRPGRQHYLCDAPMVTSSFRPSSSRHPPGDLRKFCKGHAPFSVCLYCFRLMGIHFILWKDVWLSSISQFWIIFPMTAIVFGYWAVKKNDSCPPQRVVLEGLTTTSSWEARLSGGLQASLGLRVEIPTRVRTGSPRRNCLVLLA